MNLVVLALSITTASMQPNYSPFAPLPKLRWPIAVIGHRAGANIAPENTLAAIRNAIRLKADYIEIDVRTTRDGFLVIMHDSTVDRTTDGHGDVRDMTLAEIKGLAIKNTFGPHYDGERVPTFEEVLAACHGKVNIYIDHKEAPTESVLAAIRKFKMERNVVVYNDPQDLLEWKRLAPAIPIMPSLPNSYRVPEGIARFETECPAEILVGHLREWTKDLVDQAHKAGVKVYVDIMGPDDCPDGYARAIQMGVDGIQTNYPDNLITYIQEHKSEWKRK